MESNVYIYKLIRTSSRYGAFVYTLHWAC